MIALAIIAILLVVLFVLFLMTGWNRIQHRKWLSAGLYTFPVTILLFTLFLVLLVISNLTVYKRLTHERDIAILSVIQISDQSYEVILSYQLFDRDRNSDSFLIKGDEWQLEARILKWLGWANLIGLDSYYQLDRIRGRYRNIEQEINQLPTVFAIPNESRGIDLWKLKQVMKSGLPFLDAYYGQAVFLPLKDGAEFAILINQSGLLARPRNDIARKVVSDW
ncbi:MAG: hypothetical protein GY806_17520 [Gammaproteobacteria bacterium]|nr:hypothetical protein [Gammaproteobacteria bacterium]